MDDGSEGLYEHRICGMAKDLAVYVREQKSNAENMCKVCICCLLYLCTEEQEVVIFLAVINRPSGSR